MKEQIINKIMNNTNIDFLTSSLHPGCVISTEETLAWMKQQNEKVISEINQVPLNKLKGWSLCDDAIRHNSGKFFSIDGIEINTNYRNVHNWSQPIINQPEIGFLGIITKKISGVLHFLMQAKIEPGNLNIVQLSPTLQATRSNYTRVHNGESPKYLEYFTGEKKVEILVDQLQSEQGARFLQKRNRNIIVRVPDEEILCQYEEFIWLTIKQIKDLLNYPNVINMDTRTVISCIQFGSYSEDAIGLVNILNPKSDISSSYLYSVLSSSNHLHDITTIIQWITNLKFKYELKVKNIGISNLKEWIFDGNSIFHKDRKYFDVIGVNVQIGNREVISWDQPMIRSAQEGIIGFLVKKINGIYHFLVQAKLEAGNFDIIELAPTVQCLTGNYRKGYNEYTIPYIEYFIKPSKNNIWYAVYQSEEGGRFFQEQNLNTIIEVGDEFSIEVDENYCWMTLNQLLSFVIYNNYLNIAARSLISAVRFC